jgi:hypothetical protein
MLYVHQQIEVAFFRASGKSLECERVLAHDLPNLEGYAFASGRQAIVGAQRDQHFVADSDGLDDDPAGVANGERSCQRGNQLSTWPIKNSECVEKSRPLWNDRTGSGAAILASAMRALVAVFIKSAALTISGHLRRRPDDFQWHPDR